MSRSQSGAHCHKQIAKTAKGIAAASYEALMSDNLIFSAWKKSHPGKTSKQLLSIFVENKWGLYIEAARATLVLLLREPIDEKIKEEIMEILALDSTLIRGRKNPAQIAGTVSTKH